MELGIGGRVAIVTGATRGIGLGIAEALAAEGARVCVAARGGPDVEAVAARLGGLGVAADLLTVEGCDRVVEETRRRLGPPDILVNNLGLRVPGSGWADIDAGVFAEAFAGNLLPAVRLTRAALPGMLERGWGRVVVVASIWGREAGGPPQYNVAKAAEISWCTALAREVASSGVTVNCVAPGSILFEGGGWWRRREADPEGIAEFVRREMPSGRFGSVEEVAAAVAFLCGRPASLVNGACIPVDGGQSRSNI